MTVVLDKEFEKGHERLAIEDKLWAGILRRCRVMRLIDQVMDMLMVSDDSTADGVKMPSSSRSRKGMGQFEILKL